MRRLIFLLTASDELTPANLAMACVLLLAFVVFVVARRGAVYPDFVPLYTGASCLIHGHDPYNWIAQQHQLVQVGGPSTGPEFWENFQIVYPPLTYVLLSPIALLRWPPATLLWLVLNVLVFATGAIAIIHASRPRFRWLAVLLVAAILATSNVLLALGQITLVDIGLLALACALILRNRLISGFVAMGLAVALKPQLGGLILAYFLFPRRTRSLAAGTLALLVLLSLGAGLWFSHRPQTSHWPAELRHNIAVGKAPGGSLHAGTLDPDGPNQTVSLQQLTESLSKDQTISAYMAWTIAAAIGALLLSNLVKMPAGYERDCMAIAALAMLTLLPVYHRLYDMRLVLLTVPALVLLVERRRGWGSAMVVLSTFLFFSTSLLSLRFIGERGREITAHHLAMQIFLGRQQALAVFLLALAYTAQCWWLRTTERAGPAPD